MNVFYALVAVAVLTLIAALGVGVAKADMLFGVILPYIALGPTIISAGVTLGVMQQILRAFGRVENSFQFLVMSWTTIVELMSIYKRLSAFERAIAGDTQAAIEFEAEKPATG